MSCPLSIIEYIRYHPIQTTASRCVTIDVCRVAIYLQCVAIDVPSLDLFITPDKNIWTLAEIIQCPTYDGRSYSLKIIHSGVYIRNRRFIKLDLTEAPVLKPICEPNMTRLTRTIRKPDRLVESK